MKKLLIILATSSLSLLVACQKEGVTSGPEGQAQQGLSVTALIESGSQDAQSGTKATYDSFKGKFVWSEGDRIAIHYTNGSYVTATVEPATKKVNVNAPAGKKRDYYAVYPASAAVASNYGNSTLQVTLPTTYDITDIVNGKKSFDESWCPMVALNDPQLDTLDFYHVGGLLRMKMQLLDRNSAKVRFTFNKDVTGTYTVSNPGTDHPTITSRETASGNVVTFTLNNGAGIGYRIYNESFMINVPVPCGTYENVKVEILDASGSVQESATIDRAITFSRHHGKKIPFITFCDRELTSAYIPGKFSVSDNKSVFFASGNLVVSYHSTSSMDWAFESNQYDYSFSMSNGSTYQTNGQRISHFGWGTGNIPYKISENYADYSVYNEWGKHFNAKGEGLQSRTNGTWYCLSALEWDYLVNNRQITTSSSLTAPATIKLLSTNTDIPGGIILPDVMSLADGCTFTSGTSGYGTNVYGVGGTASSGSWFSMVRSGAIFLPAAGSRSGTSFENEDATGITGHYWTSTGASDMGANGVLITTHAIQPQTFNGYFKSLGFAVRLVHD